MGPGGIATIIAASSLAVIAIAMTAKDDAAIIVAIPPGPMLLAYLNP